MSVVIPTYNRAPLLTQSIDSVLSQTFTDLELIVVDDGSTDHTEDVLRSITDPRVRCIKQPNRGASAARNTGIRAAMGEFVAFLDSDDLFLPEKTSVQMAVMDEDPTVGLVYSLLYNSTQAGPSKIEGQCYPPGSQHLPEGPKIYLPTILIRRVWLEQMGGFDEALSVAEDRELIWRLSMAGCPTSCVPKPLVIRRKQEDGLTRELHRHAVHMLAFVNKIFSDPRMPPELLCLQNQVGAKYLVLSAASAYLAAEPRVGQDLLEHALALNAALAKQDIDILVGQLVNFILGHSSQDPEDTLRLMMRYLPGPKYLTGRLGPRLWHRFHVETAFEAYRSGQHLKCRRHALRALVSNPSAALRNRGLLSILIRSARGNPSVGPRGQSS